jgi:hypothetical protein
MHVEIGVPPYASPLRVARRLVKHQVSQIRRTYCVIIPQDWASEMVMCRGSAFKVIATKVMLKIISVTRRLTVWCGSCHVSHACHAMIGMSVETEIDAQLLPLLPCAGENTTHFLSVTERMGDHLSHT